MLHTTIIDLSDTTKISHASTEAKHGQINTDNNNNKRVTLKDKIYSNFIELLFDIFTNKLAQKNELEKLIKIDYFREFGDVNYLLNSFYVFVSLYKRKTLKSAELDVFGITLENIKLDVLSSVLFIFTSFIVTLECCIVMVPLYMV